VIHYESHWLGSTKGASEVKGANLQSNPLKMTRTKPGRFTLTQSKQTQVVIGIVQLESTVIIGLRNPCVIFGGFCVARCGLKQPNINIDFKLILIKVKGTVHQKTVPKNPKEDILKNVSTILSMQ